MTGFVDWAVELSSAQLIVGLSVSVLVTWIVGTIRVHAVAASLQAHHEGEMEQVATAVEAAEKSVIWAAEELCRGVRPPLPPDPERAAGGSLSRVLELIGNLQVQGAGAMLRVHDESQAAVLVEMHKGLSRRQHVLIGEMLEHLTLLQEATEDPDLLDRSFKIDHLATRMRRMVESVSVVLGGASLRETRRPVSVSTVLRGAKAEVVKYTRVRIAAGDVGSAFALPAHVHPDVAHLLAELIDNGLDHSDPASSVFVRAQRVNKGLLIEVEDRAVLLMEPAKRQILNRLLRSPEQADVAQQVRQGSLGLITAARIASKHGLDVWLSMNPTGGTTASVVVPRQYLVATSPAVGTVTVPTARSAARPFEGRLPARQAKTPGTGMAPPTPQAMGDGTPLPRRQPTPRPMPAAQQSPAAPARAATPSVVADWREGLNAGLHTNPPA
ncbi:sensor histidine kinase [Streptomyces olivaceus]